MSQDEIYRALRKTIYTRDTEIIQLKARILELEGNISTWKRAWKIINKALEDKDVATDK